MENRLFSGFCWWWNVYDGLSVFDGCLVVVRIFV